MSRLLISLMFILSFSGGSAQTALPLRESPVELLSRKLTSSCKNDYEKVRSIFLWITDNISYHTKFLTTGKKKTDDEFLLDADDTSATLQPLVEHVAGIVLKRRTAVCDGYTKLFKSLCDHAGIRSEIVLGFARTNFSNNPKFRTNHSWNAVYVDSSWHLLDVTWASGFVYGNQFVRSFDDYYFFTPPKYFIRDHYPEDLKWTLLSEPPVSRELYQSPFMYTEFLRQKIVSFFPAKGMIRASAGDTIHFAINSEYQNLSFAVTDVVADSLACPAITSTNGKAEYHYPVTGGDDKWLYVICNDEIVLRYRLTLNRNKKSE